MEFERGYPVISPHDKPGFLRDALHYGIHRYGEPGSRARTDWTKQVQDAAETLDDVAAIGRPAAIFIPPALLAEVVIAYGADHAADKRILAAAEETLRSIDDLTP